MMLMILSQFHLFNIYHSHYHDDEECGNTDGEDGDDDESLKGRFHLTEARVNDMKSFVIWEEFQKTISSCVKFNRKCGFQNNLTGSMDL